MSQPERQIISLLGEAVEYRSPEERAAFLDKACAGDAGQRARVEELLRAYQAAGNFLQGSPSLSNADATVDEPVRERPGTVIGPYKLMEQIGEGGMGLVFVAEQQQPVRRKVALKVIKPGMDSRAVIARFEAERQALALMDHPNIAKVHDGGTTPVGRPYFVMELVKGVPITEYCDQNQVPIRERLELFVAVCQAVQHAHQKGIIHRDLKPSNVLVVSNDGTPLVKVIDFGVAKAVGQQLTDKTIYTQFTQLLGTPLYMSPEQAGQSGVDVDTRTDIYALGVLLYELLTGTTPFDKKRFKEAAYEEMRRMIREEEPPKPSTRISTLGQAATTISTQRQSDPKRLGQLVRGELDWIVMKALEKDRNRRYETASTLAADVQRYLTDQPVQAFPPSPWYRFSKFARRYRVAFVMAALAAAVLLVALCGLVVGLIAVDREQTLTEKANRLLARNLYYQTVHSAEREYATGHVGRAEKLLNDETKCPPALRGWEWHYLKRLRYGSRPPLHHPGHINSLVLSPDGRILVAAGTDGQASLWDPERWELLRRLPVHPDQVHRVVFNPAGRQLATGCWDGRVRVWDVHTGRLLRTVGDGADGVFGLAWSPDGRWLVAGTDKTTVWDAESGARLRTLPGHPAGTQAIAFSPDGRRLAVTDGDVTVSVRDTTTWREVATLESHLGGAWSLAFSPDGRQLAVACGQGFMSGDEGEVRLWEVESGRTVYSLRGHSGGAFVVAFSPDGRYLASGGNEDATVQLWDTTTGQATLALRGHRDAIWGLAFSRDGGHLYSAGADQTTRDWDARPLADDTTTELRSFRGHTGRVTSVVFSPDQKRLVSGGMDRSVHVWDVLTGRPIRELTGFPGGVLGVAFHRDGSMLASACYFEQGEVRLWDAHSWQPLRTFSYPPDCGGSVGAGFDPEGHLLGTLGDQVLLWDVTTGLSLHTLVGARSNMSALAVGPRGWVACSEVNGTVKLWHLAPA
jgi:WD40 repeat protein/serine/threonine protein kinase